MANKNYLKKIRWHFEGPQKAETLLDDFAELIIKRGLCAPIVRPYPVSHHIDQCQE